MAIKNKPVQDIFLPTLKEVEDHIFVLGFEPYAFKKSGYAYYVEYKKGNCVFEIMYGPPEYHVEIILYIANRKYSLNELYEIPAISTWISNNRYKLIGGEKIKTELLWFIELLKVSLAVIEA